jgi:hypothetical protein
MQNHVIEVLVVGQGDLKGVTKELLAEKIFDDRRFKVLSVQIDEG